MLSSIIVVLLLATVQGLASVHPTPKSLSSGPYAIQLPSPCDLRFLFVDSTPEIADITLFYMTKTFPNSECDFTKSIVTGVQYLLMGRNGQPGEILVELTDSRQEYELNTANEKYTLTIDQTGGRIKADTYVGYLRALDTLSQLISEDGEGNYQIEGIPLTIEDEPAFPYRAIMIDTARHYLSVATIKRTIDSMLFNKLNVLHWHITDDESFPLLIKSFPSITKTAAYSDKHVFTYEDVKDVLAYAKSKGVIVVPEIDTPGHVWSWGKSEELAAITVQCGVQYGQFDPTLDLTYKVVEGVMREIAELFKDSPFIHLGGDEVVTSCWNKRPQIKEFMVQHGIKDYVELQTYYRERQKTIWRQIQAKQPVAYWANAEINLPVQEDDVIHWWGRTPELEEIKDKKNKIILSNYDLLYLDTGFNNAFGNQYGAFHTWKDIYNNFDPFPQNIAGTVIGGEVCMWGETNTESTHFLKLYVRASAFAERIWNPLQKNHEKLSDFVKRLVQVEYRMEKLGFPVLPVTSQFCSLHVDQCYP